MKSMFKAATLQKKLPILSVRDNMIISKDADITLAYELSLPEIFTVSGKDYDMIHSAWVKALGVLPEFTVFHKQDWFVKEKYKPRADKDGMSYLSKSFEKHFNERPYLNHKCYVFLSLTTKERSNRKSNFSILCRGRIVPRPMTSEEHIYRFTEAADQFQSIINDCPYLLLRKLTEEDITGTPDTPGLIHKYLNLSTDGDNTLRDIRVEPDKMVVGNQELCLHTLSEPESLPTEVQNDSRQERWSTDRSDCRMSYAAPVGLLLPWNHIYNQYIFLDDSADNLRQFERTARNMVSLAQYSRSNQINAEWINEYLNTAHLNGQKSVRAHYNVMS